jgi:hypothetical protein
MPKTTHEFLYDFGDRVRFVDTDIIGQVVSLWLSDRGPKYEVAYFTNGEYKTEYFFDFQIEPADKKNGTGFAVSAGKRME